MNNQPSQISSSFIIPPKGDIANLLLALVYFPFGGIIYAFIGLFSKYQFVKFHASQALIWWLLWFIIYFPFMLLVAPWNSNSNFNSYLVLIIYPGLFFFILPIIFLIKAYKHQVFFLFFGKSIAKLYKIDKAGIVTLNNELVQQPINQQYLVKSSTTIFAISIIVILVIIMIVAYLMINPI